MDESHQAILKRVVLCTSEITTLVAYFRENSTQDPTDRDMAISNLPQELKDAALLLDDATDYAYRIFGKIYF